MRGEDEREGMRVGDRERLELMQALFWLMLLNEYLELCNES